MTKEQELEIQGTDARWLSRAQIGGLSPDQICWLSPAQICWLSPDQIGWLSPDQKNIADAIVKGVPVLEKPYTKILAAIEAGGLNMDQWHTCKTTHCVGGWTCVLAPGGKEFEKLFPSTGDAAAQILRKSRPDAPLPNFVASDEAAMAFIRARAKEEALLEKHPLAEALLEKHPLAEFKEDE